MQTPRTHHTRQTPVLRKANETCHVMRKHTEAPKYRANTKHTYTAHTACKLQISCAPSIIQKTQEKVNRKRKERRKKRKLDYLESCNKKSFNSDLKIYNIGPDARINETLSFQNWVGTSNPNFVSFQTSERQNFRFFYFSSCFHCSHPKILWHAEVLSVSGYANFV